MDSRRKTLVLIRNLILGEVVAYGALMAVALSAHWAKLYRAEFPQIERYLSFTVLEFALLAAVQTALIVFVVRRSLNEDEHDIHDLIRIGEHERLEFKTSLRWDAVRQQVNRDLERSVMKTVAAFLNTEGGELVIGVDDRKRIAGLGPDLVTLVKSDHDGFENHFNNIFLAMLGPEFRRFVRLSFHDIAGRSVCLVRVARAHRPAYLKSDKGEDFFIRTGNATTSLKMSEATAYVSSWHRQ